MTSIDLYHRRVWNTVRPLWAWRLLRLALRAAWLAGVLAGGGALTSADLGWPLAFDQWLVVGAAAFPILFGLLTLWPVSTPALVRRMDAALAAHDQLSAAREVAARGPQNYIEARLLDDAESLLTTARARLPRAVIPWADLEMCLLVAVVIFALRLNLGASGASLPPADYVPLLPLGQEPTVNLPGLPPELSTFGQSPPFISPEEAQTDALDVDPATAQQALDALARALAEASATQSAANNLAQGDVPQAASDLRQLAEAAESLDPATRAQLADQLQQTAEQLAASAPDVAEQLQQLAENLRNPDPSFAGEALAALARLVEDLRGAQNPITQTAQREGGSSAPNQTGGVGFSSTAGREIQTGAPSDRLASEGEVVRLTEGEALSTEAGTLQGPSHVGAAEAEGAVSSSVQGEGSGSAGGVGSDPLTYSWRWRDVVQGYFSNQ
jgi:hypothetical protein